MSDELYVVVCRLKRGKRWRLDGLETYTKKRALAEVEARTKISGFAFVFDFALVVMPALTDLLTPSKSPTREAAKEPAKRWKNKYLAVRVFQLTLCSPCACGRLLDDPIFRPGDEYLGCRTFPTPEAARAGMTNKAPGYTAYLGPIPIESPE